jgi:hypothetical protein
MRSLIVAIAFAIMAETSPVTTCTVGDALPGWVGPPEKLAEVEAVYQASFARSSDQAFPSGAPSAPPWRGQVRCQTTSTTPTG